MMKIRVKRKRALAALLAVTMAVGTMTVGSAAALTPTGTTMIARVIGATPVGETMPNPNQTAANYNVGGTDLGIVWDKGGGQYFVAFGDTNDSAGNWTRSNLLAISSDTNLADGLSFDTMIQSSPGYAKEMDGNGWATGEASARPVAIGVAGEMSVAYSDGSVQLV